MAAGRAAMISAPATVRVEQVKLLLVTGQLDDAGLARLQRRFDELLDDGALLLLADLSGVPAATTVVRPSRPDPAPRRAPRWLAATGRAGASGVGRPRPGRPTRGAAGVPIRAMDRPWRRLSPLRACSSTGDPRPDDVGDSRCRRVPQVRSGVSPSRRPEHPGRRLACRDAPDRSRREHSRAHVPDSAPSRHRRRAAGPARLCGPHRPPTRGHRAVARAAVVAANRRADHAALHGPSRRTEVRARRRCLAPHLSGHNGLRATGRSTRPTHLAVWAQHGPDPFSIIAPSMSPPAVIQLATYTARHTRPSTSDQHSPPSNRRSRESDHPPR